MTLMRVFCVAGLVLGLAACQDSGLDLSAKSGRRVVVGPSVPVAIESIEGTPQEVAPRFSAAMAAEAQAREVSFVDADQAPRFRLRGYLTAAPGDGGTVVSFVWDLFDQGQKRAQRVAGSEIIKRTAAESWSAVDDPALKRVASRSMDAIAEFLVGVARPEAPVAGRQGQAPAEARAASE